MHKFTLFLPVWIAMACMTLAADPPAKTSESPEPESAELEPLTPEAEKIVEELRASLAKDSEALAMLESILTGSTLGPEDGWFPLAKAQTRYEWNTINSRFDTNKDGSISGKEFAGSEADFKRLDRDGSGSLSEADFDWSQHSLSPSPGMSLFFMTDRDGNGKLTQDEFTQLFQNLAGQDSEFIALDDVRDQFQPPARASAGDKRPDRPSRSTLITGLKQQEIGSLQAGPKVEEVAPDFTLKSLDGQEVTLSKVVGPKPVVLIFGNFTCGPFRSQAGNIEKLFERYQDRANFYLVYVREAHPSDGWSMQSNQRVGIDLTQPKDTDSRRTIAATCRDRLKLDIPFLVDSVDDTVGANYSGMPNRLYLIDQQGKIAFKNGRGPFGFHPRQLEQALILLLNSKP